MTYNLRTFQGLPQKFKDFSRKKIQLRPFQGLSLQFKDVLRLQSLQHSALPFKILGSIFSGS